MSEPDDRVAWIRREVAQHEAALVAYAARLLGGDVQAGQDAAQEAYLRLLREPRERLEGRTREWLFTVVRNLCRDVNARDRRMGPLTEIAARERAELLDGRADCGSSADPAAPLVEAETRARVLSLLAELPANQREVLRLKFQAGLSYREIAAVTKLSIGNVGFQMHVGLRSLRERLANEIQEGLAS